MAVPLQLATYIKTGARRLECLDEAISSGLMQASCQPTVPVYDRFFHIGKGKARTSFFSASQLSVGQCACSNSASTELGRTIQHSVTTKDAFFAMSMDCLGASDRKWLFE